MRSSRKVASTLHRTLAGVVLTIAVVTVAVLAAPSVTAQQPTAASSYEAEPSVLQAPCCRFVNYYLWPSEPQHYRCCVTRPQELAPLTGGQVAVPVAPVDDGIVVTPNASNPRLIQRRAEPTCVNLTQLSPLERLLSQTVFGGSCVDFVTYDHFPCSCQTFCNDASWLCNCPGVPAGELPEIKPQDSLGSQPEFVSTTCIPCNTESTCSGGTPPPGKSPT